MKNFIFCALNATPFCSQMFFKKIVELTPKCFLNNISKIFYKCVMITRQKVIAVFLFPNKHRNEKKTMLLF